MRTALTTNQIAGFVTVPSWEKINDCVAAFFEIRLFKIVFVTPSDGEVVSLHNVILEVASNTLKD